MDESVLYPMHPLVLVGLSMAKKKYTVFVLLQATLRI